MNKKELAKYLYDYGVYDAFQYISNTQKTIGTACFCKDAILSLISRMKDEHSKWVDEIFENLSEQTDQIKKIAIRPRDMPSYNISVADVEVTAPFLLDKLTKDFFQYSRNAFDCMAQVSNAACLAFKAKKIDVVDFENMKKVFAQQMYSQEFPSINQWFQQVSSSNEYEYIAAFNNRTKHNCDVYLNLSMAILGSESTSSINPFYRKDMQHDAKQDISQYLTAIYEFVSKSYTDFLVAIKAEVQKKTHINDRYHKLSIYQQKMKSSKESSFSLAYIDATDCISKMPEEIQVMLIAESDGEISAKTCPIDTIYIKDPCKDHWYTGKYVAEDEYGEDTLVRYRKYNKETYQEGTLPLSFQAMDDPKQKNIFYHANMFMDVHTVSDDDDFIKRVQLPF